ncbi:hypothetical protein LJK88_43455 [Paenibacillus sp. P26]|nr:hypothetical protein LJK88_43455 [Paenibacillus sp. P26]
MNIRLSLGLLIFFITLFHLIAAPAASASEPSPKAVSGVLDLSSWNSSRDGDVSLDGQWEFYWSKLLIPEDFRRIGSHPGPQYIAVPSVWTSFTSDGKHLPGDGYATYRLTIKRNAGGGGEQMALYIPSVATSYRLWINGQLSAGNGTVGTDKATMVPKNVPKVVYFTPSGDDIELVIQVSNFVQRKAGLWESFKLGTAESIGYEREKNILREMFLAGGLFLMGIFYLCFYFSRRAERAFFFFSATCLMLSIRTTMLGETLAVRMFPAMSWESAVKIEYVTGMLTLPCFLWYGYCCFPNEMRSGWVKLSSLLTAGYILLVLSTQASTYTYFMPSFEILAILVLLYMVYVLIMAVVRRKDGALLHGIALLFFFAAVVNDTLYYNHILHTGDMIPYGIFCFLFLLGLHLARRFSRSLTYTERLTVELQELNESLENKVRERTAELEHFNRRLQQANESISLMDSSRRSLLSNITHELRTPLTLIQGYAEALSEGVIRGDRSRYFTLILQKAKLLDHIFNDLIELSRLEARQIQFHFEPYPAVQPLQHLFDKYEMDLKEKELQVSLCNLPDPEESRPIRVHVDALRIEQVFANFMMNAQKYTPAGEWLPFTLISRGKNLSSRLRIRDPG